MMPTTPRGCGSSLFVAGKYCSSVATCFGAIQRARFFVARLISARMNSVSAIRVSVEERLPKSAEITSANFFSLLATIARNRVSRSRRSSSVGDAARDSATARRNTSSILSAAGCLTAWFMDVPPAGSFLRPDCTGFQPQGWSFASPLPSQARSRSGRCEGGGAVINS